MKQRNRAELWFNIAVCAVILWIYVSFVVMAWTWTRVKSPEPTRVTSSASPMSDLSSIHQAVSL